MKLLVDSFILSKRFPDYQPRPITPLVVLKYLKQFPRGIRSDIIRLLRLVRYVSRGETELLLVDQCREAVEGLKSAGIDESDIIIAPAHHDVGRSAVYAFKVVRDGLCPEFPQIRFHETGPSAARDIIPIRRGSAVVFVDDFVGTGHQFASSFSAWSQALGGRSPRFILVVAAVCTEGKQMIEDNGTLVRHGIVHRNEDRFLDVCRDELGEASMRRIAVLASELHSKWPFGYKNRDSLIVVHRNCPNNVPYILRGSQGQRIWFGLFPRIDQMSPNSFDDVMRDAQPDRDKPVPRKRIN